MSASNNILATLVNGFGTFLVFVVEVTLLVISLTAVKGRRPDAWLPLAIGAGIHVFATVLSSLVYTFLLPALLHSGGVDNILTIHAVVGFVFTLIHLAGWGGVIFGVVRLANGPRSDADPTRYG